MEGGGNQTGESLLGSCRLPRGLMKSIPGPVFGPSNWSPGLILGAVCTMFRARPDYRGLGAKFGQKSAKNLKLKLKFILLILNEGRFSFLI